MRDYYAKIIGDTGHPALPVGAIARIIEREWHYIIGFGLDQQVTAATVELPDSTPVTIPARTFLYANDREVKRYLDEQKHLRSRNRRGLPSTGLRIGP